MKKYLLGLSALALAVGFSSFSAIKTSASKKFTDTYWAYPATAPQNASGYETNTNYVSSGSGPFSSCDNGNEQECVVEVSATVTSGGHTYPSFTSASFTSSGFPEPGTGAIVANATTDQN